MTDENHSFAQARVRLEEIVAQVRKKDTSLEHSLDLLEEGVRLANICTELSDHTEWRNVIEEREGSSVADTDPASAAAGGQGGAVLPDGSVDDDAPGDADADAEEPWGGADGGAETASGDEAQPEPEGTGERDEQGPGPDVEDAGDEAPSGR